MRRHLPLMGLAATILALGVGTWLYQQAPADDPCHAACEINTSVTQSNIHSTICVRGWAATVRPPVSYTNDLKRRQMNDLGLNKPAYDYEEDHRMPLELGGNPMAEHNLSPQLRAQAGGTAEEKDRDEDAMREAVCSGRMSLRDAQRQFISTWLADWPGYRQ